MADEAVSTKILPPPRNVDDALVVLRKVLELPKLRFVSVDATGITIRRVLREDEDEVVPPDLLPEELTGDAIYDTLVDRQMSEVAFDPEMHAFHRIWLANAKIEAARRRVVAYLVQDLYLFAAFLGLEEPVSSFFGVPVFSVPRLDQRAVAVASTTRSLRDADGGVFFDLGE